MLLSNLFTIRMFCITKIKKPCVPSSGSEPHPLRLINNVPLLYVSELMTNRTDVDDGLCSLCSAGPFKQLIVGQPHFTNLFSQGSH